MSKPNVKALLDLAGLIDTIDPNEFSVRYLQRSAIDYGHRAGILPDGLRFDGDPPIFLDEHGRVRYSAVTFHSKDGKVFKEFFTAIAMAYGVHWHSARYMFSDYEGDIPPSRVSFKIRVQCEGYMNMAGGSK